MGAIERYADEICREIRERQEEIRATLGLNTLYIGGGTPSVLPLPVLRRIVEALSEVTGVPVGPAAAVCAEGAGGRERCRAAADGRERGRAAADGRERCRASADGCERCRAAADGRKRDQAAADERYEEFTIEVNPEDIVERGPEFVRGLLELGVTRISMGVQSLDDGILRWMNRRHDAARARQAWQILREGAKTFPPPQIYGRREHSPVCSLSVDLIIGVPGMTNEILSETLKELVAWRPDHISAYQLSIEEGSTLADLIASGKVSELPEEQCQAQYEMVCRALASAGYEHYEISNWALPGQRSIHNSAYWTRRPYVGLGPGAHSLEGGTVSSCPGGAGEDSLKGGIGRPDRSGPGEDSLEGGIGCPDRSGPGEDSPEGGMQRRSWNSKELSGWTREGEVLSPEEIREERIMLGLRTADGVEPELLAKGAEGASVQQLGAGAEGGSEELLGAGAQGAEEIGGKTGANEAKGAREIGFKTGGKKGGQLPDGLEWNGGRIRISEGDWFIADDIIANLI